MALRLHCNTTTTNSTLLSTDSSHCSLASNSPHSELIRSYLNYDGRLGVLVVDLQANAGPPLLGVFEFKSKFKLIGPNGVVPKSFRVTVACCMRGDFGDSGGLYKAVGGYRTSYGTQISMARDAIQRRQGHKKSRVSPIRNKLLQSQQMRFYLRFWCEPLLPTYLAGTYSFAVPCSKKVTLRPCGAEQNSKSTYFMSSSCCLVQFPWSLPRSASHV